MNYHEYLLVHTGEEASEVTKACSKALRFGLTHIWMAEGGKEVRDVIRSEILDMLVMAADLQTEGMIAPISYQDITAHRDMVKEKRNRMLQLSRERGTITP